MIPETHDALERRAAELRLNLAGRDVRALTLDELREAVRVAEADRHRLRQAEGLLRLAGWQPLADGSWARR